MKEYCSEKQMTEGIAYWKDLCAKNGDELANIASVEATVTAQYIAALPIIAPDTYNTSVPITSPVLLEKSYYKRYLRRLKATIDATPTNLLYGSALIGYWAGIIFLGSLYNLVSFMSMLYSRRSSNDVENTNSKAQSLSLPRPLAAIRYYCRLYLVIPATITTYHQRALYWCTIPTRLDSLIVFGFWAISIVLSCVNLGSFSGNPTTPDVSEQNWVYLSDRTAVLSYACLCWLWMFGGRNNIFLWSTGWSYGTFSIFHRHVALVATLEAVVHSIGYTVQWNVYSSDYIPALKDLYFVLGIVATIIMCLMVVFAILPIRQRFYELFLIIHISFAIVLIYCLYIHTAKIGAVYYSGYLWPPVAIWSFDRFLRLVRLAWCNIRVWNGSAASTKAVVNYSAASDVIRIEIRNASVKGGPGQYYYLYQPMTLRGWENHPFTLGAFSTHPRSISSMANSDEKQPSSRVSETNSSSESSFTLTFWVRPHNGWTKRLRDQCLKQAGPFHPTLLIEGAYGHRKQLHTYHTIIMIMGGTGIACAIPYLQAHLAQNLGAPGTQTIRIQLHWTIRQPAFINEVFQEELAGILSNPDVQALFYCSQNDQQVAKKLDSEQSGSEETDIPPSSPVVQSGRAPIDSIVAEAAATAMAEQTSIAVMACGPAAMADQTRAAVHTAMKNGCRTMEYFEEAYGW
ncbi:hypothetical protein N7540_011886 [Penicillium herquei]|nr:hypothetical protein N7540_011886 [Penicillium herquei]